MHRFTACLINLNIWILLEKCNADCSRLFLSKYGLSGEFTSPGYPQHYPSHAQCRLVFNGTADERIRITFEDFDLEPGNSAGCLFDYVDVFTVDRFGRMELEERICGSQLPAQIATVHNRIELVFKSDYASSRKGFRGKYEFVDETWQPFPTSAVCGPTMETGVGGEILSPNYPYPYPHNTDCTWMIRVERSRQIVASFITLDLGQSVSCATTFVAIYDGFGSPSLEPAKKVCGQLYFDKKNLWQFQSTGYRVVIRFHDKVNEYGNKGFQIAWAAVQHKTATCTQFLCRGGEYCIDGVFCIPLQSYCIDASLRCNSIPNCGAFDHSDEQMCLKQISQTVVAVLIPTLFIVFLAVRIYCIIKRKRAARQQKEQQQQHQRIKQQDSCPLGADKHTKSLCPMDDDVTDVGNEDVQPTTWFSPAYCSHDYRRPTDTTYNLLQLPTRSKECLVACTNNDISKGSYTLAADIVMRSSNNCKRATQGDERRLGNGAKVSGRGENGGELVRQDSTQTASSSEGGQDYRPYTACSYGQLSQPLASPTTVTGGTPRRRQATECTTLPAHQPRASVSSTSAAQTTPKCLRRQDQGVCDSARTSVSVAPIHQLSRQNSHSTEV